jgi:phosphoglycolate phosphatase-like HAD superfamily hydrolase
LLARDRAAETESQTALVVPSHRMYASLFGRPANKATTGNCPRCLCDFPPSVELGRVRHLIGWGFGDMRGNEMFEGFIFDVEGTLIDSVLQNQRSLQDALEKSGNRIPIQTLRLYSGLDGDQTVQLVVPDASERERRAILEDRREIFERDYLPSVKPLEGARDAIRILAEKGGRVALATDCKGPPYARYMSLLDASDHIAATACGDDLEHGKPDPRLVGIALRKLGLAGSQTVMVGDTPYDAEAALEAGTKAAGVLTGGFSESVLVAAGCFAVAPDLRTLLPCLLSGVGGINSSQTDWLRSA